MHRCATYLYTSTSAMQGRYMPVNPKSQSHMQREPEELVSMVSDTVLITGKSKADARGYIGVYGDIWGSLWGLGFSYLGVCRIWGLGFSHLGVWRDIWGSIRDLGFSDIGVYRDKLGSIWGLGFSYIGVHRDKFMGSRV